MSKEITKKELDLVIESTLEEAGLVSEKTLCEECGGTIVEGICEGGNLFVGERQKAIDAGKDEFEVDGKTYKVEESTEDNNDKLLKEELNKFNKIINYRK